MRGSMGRWRDGARFARAGQRALLLVALLLAGPARAQTPFPSYAYVVGIEHGLHLAGRGRIVGAEPGLPNTWIAFVHRNLASSLPHGSGYYVKAMRLVQPRLPGMRWDTVPGSPWPLLVVTRDQGAVVLNHRDGSVAGLNLSREGKIDLFIYDPSGRVAAQVPGLVLEVETLDGVIRVPVEPYNIYDRQY